jgi:hypothetical protein
MKTFVLIFALMILNLASYSQTYKSSHMITQKAEMETEWKDRVITITDKEISISNFLDGSTKTLYLTIDKIENVNYAFDGLRKTYRCTSTHKDLIAGYQKVMVYYTPTLGITVAMFVDEITVMKYQFGVD